MCKPSTGNTNFAPVVLTAQTKRPLMMTSSTTLMSPFPAPSPCLPYQHPSRQFPSPIPQSLPLTLPLYKRRLLILILITHPPPRRGLPIDPATRLSLTRRTPTPNLPHHRPRLALLLSSHPLCVPRFAVSGVLVYLRSFGW